MEDLPEIIDADQIIKNLWQGSAPPAGDILSRKGFKLVVLAAEEHQNADLYTDIDVYLAPSDDIPSRDCVEQFLPIWLDAAKHVANTLKNGDKVLVTCMAGLNRSGMVTALTLTMLTTLTGNEIVDRIQSRREFALSNREFERFIRTELDDLNL
jgi:protein-tyrosine phosphatase